MPSLCHLPRPALIPGFAPPYDDHPAPAPGRAPAPVPPRPRPVLAQAGAPGRSAPGPGAPGASTPAAGGPVSGWPQHFAQMLAETLSGARPPGQLTRWATGRARRHIELLGPALALAATPQVRRLVTFRPSADVMEMTVLLGVGPQTRALAVRLERGQLRAAPRPAAAGPWRCTAVEAA